MSEAWLLVKRCAVSRADVFASLLKYSPVRLTRSGQNDSIQCVWSVQNTVKERRKVWYVLLALPCFDRGSVGAGYAPEATRNPK